MTTPDRVTAAFLGISAIACGFTVFVMVRDWSTLTPFEARFLMIPVAGFLILIPISIWMWRTKPVVIPGPSWLDQVDQMWHEVAKKLLEDLAVEDAAKVAGREKLCKDCRFAHSDPFVIISLPAEWTCSHPTATYHPPQDLVTGADSPPYQLPCFIARGKGSSYTKGQQCGPEGRYWEERNAD